VTRALYFDSREHGLPCTGNGYMGFGWSLVSDVALSAVVIYTHVWNKKVGYNWLTR